MRKRNGTFQLSYTLALTALLIGTSRLDAKFAGGTGEPNDPYQIATAGHLIAMGTDLTLLDKHFILMADIDLDPKLPGRQVFDRAVIAPHTRAQSSRHGIDFEGTFDGNGHRIKHLTIRSDRTIYLGFFGSIGKTGRVQNLGLENASINGPNGSRFLGGLAGCNSGYITNCYVTGRVSAGNESHTVGGLVGYNYGGVITNCYTDAKLSVGRGSRSLGGLAGYSGEGTIAHCYSTGRVSAKRGSGHVGALVEAHGVNRCFWDVRTSGLSNSATGVGRTTRQMQDVQTFLNAGWDFVGERSNGLADTWQMPKAGGYPQLTVFSDDYQRPRLVGGGTPDDPYRIEKAEDLGTMSRCSASACYRLTSDLDLSGITWTTAPIQDFNGVFDGGGFTISELTIHGGNLIGLFGKLGSSAVVRNLTITDANIIAEDEAWYVGALAGLSHGNITGCRITGQLSGGNAVRAVGGLVGGVYQGEVTSCCADCEVSAGRSADQIGVLIGWDYSGNLTRCFAAGSVAVGEQSRSIGGLVGDLFGRVAVSYSYARVKVFASRQSRELGGLIGSISDGYDVGPADGVINCYATGPVKATDDSTDVGGLLGSKALRSPAKTHQQVWTKKCYFLDSRDGNRSDNANGTALSDEQMKQQASFVGWDFDSVWTIAEGKDYPVLRWEQAAQNQ